MTTSELSDRDRGLELLRSGSYEQSLPHLIRAIVEDPHNPDLHLFLALAYSQMGQIDKAVEMLEQAADLAPTSAKIHYNLGVAYQRARNLTQAKDEYLRALGLDPNYEAPRKALDFLLGSQQ